MNNMTLYGNNPFDLIDQIFSGEDLPFSQYRTPIVDVLNEDKRYVIEAELPGLSEKDVKIELKDGNLSISADRSSANDEKKADDRWLRRERREFKFSRSFSLSDDVDIEKIEAKFRDGLLTIALPKKAESAPRIVPVLAA
ncbi:MAG: Hsp20/alpha crystallin family protein [Rectinemataceae bacterium]